MHSRERILAALHGQPVDRRPFVPVLSSYGARLTNMPLSRYYREPALYAAGQQAVVETFGVDAVIAPLLFPCEGEAFGSELRFYDNQPPNIRRMAGSSIDEFLAMKMPDPVSNPSYVYLLESARLTVERCGKDALVGAILTTPLDLPSLVVGIEGWLDALMFRRELLPQVFDRLVPQFLARARLLKQAGIDFYVISGGFDNSTTVMRSLVESTILPVLKRCLGELELPALLHNGGGSLLAFADLYGCLPQVAGIYLDGQEMAEARAGLPASCALIGGFTELSVQAGTPEQLYQQARALLQERRDDARFVLATIGPDVPLNTPAENILALRRAIRDEATEK